MLSDFISRRTIANNAKVNRPSKLIVNGKEIHSLSELRENLDAEEILKALDNDSLVGFMESHFYEREASILSNLSLKNTDCLEIICSTLGIRYQKKTEELTEAEFKKLEFLRDYPLDSDVFKHFNSIALNQEELAALLQKSKKLIYLLDGVFSVPLSKKSILILCSFQFHTKKHHLYQFQNF